MARLLPLIWITLVLALGVFMPVTADLSEFGAPSFDCGPVWSAGTAADDLSPVVDEICERNVRSRPWIVLGAMALGLLVGFVVRRATSSRPSVPPRSDVSQKSSEVTLVVLAFAAPLLSLGILLPFVLYWATRRNPRLAVPVARAFDCQLAGLVVGVVTAGLVLSSTPSSAPGAVVLVPVLLGSVTAMLVIAWRTIRRSLTGEAWTSSWRPLLVPPAVTDSKSTSAGRAVKPRSVRQQRG
ncbi:MULTISPECIES: hypothetical protein [Aeromicrobium]|uniref:hypothetical protein n=1 Tax=Aeromicrobium TaxID=2040 RepID=UPI002580BF36|nr:MULTISPECIES: hypothetical protein [Aeromicrobium]